MIWYGALYMLIADQCGAKLSESGAKLSDSTYIGGVLKVHKLLLVLQEIWGGFSSCVGEGVEQ